jgi:2-oxoglutarate dehydrogenase E2 component (dihydrolipoamide succinyltransferase)
MKTENIETISGSCKGNRITKQDVIASVKTKSSDNSAPIKETKKEVAEGNSQATTDQPVEKNLTTRALKTGLTELEEKERLIEKKKISNIRKTIAKRLHQAQQNTAMLTTFNEVNMDAIFKIRKEYKDVFQESYDTKLGFLSFFVRASCLALLEFPDVNSQINLEAGEQSFFNYVDMGIAVSSPRGLVVPVLQNAHRLSLANIEKEILILAKKARSGKLQVDEMIGGTFTITNGGIFGSMLSTPILNTPQSAILGMHNIVPRAVVIDGEIQVANMMYLALTYDHRVIDGKSAVSFLGSIKNYLEDPVRMLLGV